MLKLSQKKEKKWGSSDKSIDNDTFTNEASEASWKMETIIYNNLRPILIIQHRSCSSRV